MHQDSYCNIMSNIKVMDEVLANKIAAGEVVEKCMNVVKELVENSIDAKADEIEISLKESGIEEIEVECLKSRQALPSFLRLVRPCFEYWSRHDAIPYPTAIY